MVRAVPPDCRHAHLQPHGHRAILILTNELPDGNHTLTINASDIANSAGVPASGSRSNFFVLKGDVNRDRTVNFDHLPLVAQNYGQLRKTFSGGNFNYDAAGEVGFDDLLLAQRYGKCAGANFASHSDKIGRANGDATERTGLIQSQKKMTEAAVFAAAFLFNGTA